MIFLSADDVAKIRAESEALGGQLGDLAYRHDAGGVEVTVSFSDPRSYEGFLVRILKVFGREPHGLTVAWENPRRGRVFWDSEGRAHWV